MSTKIIAADISTIDVIAIASLTNKAIQIPNDSFRNILQAYCSLMKFVWQPTSPLTPQQVLTQLYQGGVAVGKLMAFGQLALTMIRSIVQLEGLQLADLTAMVGADLISAVNSNAFFDPNQSPIPNGLGLTINSDGSPTVTQPA